MSLGRITYNEIDIDFPRGFNALEQKNVSSASVITGSDGSDEESYYHDINMVRIQKTLENSNIVNQLGAFWNTWAKSYNNFELWLDRNLACYIPFEGESLNTLDGETGILAGSETWVAGRSGGALTLTTGNKLTYLINEVPRTQWSIEIWFKPSWVYNSHADARLFQSGTEASNLHSDIYVSSAGNIIFTAYADNDNTQGFQLSVSGSDLSQSTWHRLSFTCDSTVSNGGKIYVDSVLKGTSSNSSFTASNTGDSIILGSTIATADPALGDYCDFLMTKNVLDATQINQNYNWPYSLHSGQNYYPTLITAQNLFNPLRRVGNKFDFDFEMREDIAGLPVAESYLIDDDYGYILDDEGGRIIIDL